MRARLAAALALAAVGLHYGVSEPARLESARASDEHRRLRDERRELMRRLQPLERHEAARARAVAALVATPLPKAWEPQLMRRSVLARLGERPLRGVRVAVRPSRGASAASVSLTCEGELREVLSLVTDLVRPGSGLVLDRVRLGATPGGVQLELDAEGVRVRQ